MPTIVTHINPHIDEITALWLVRRFAKGWSKCAIKFSTTNPKGEVKHHESSSTIMFIGIGRGAFDEHKGNVNDSATTLVFKHLIKMKKINVRPHERAALDELVAFVNADDHGTFVNAPYAEFSIAAASAYLVTTGRLSSKELVGWGETYLDGVYAALTEKHALATDWKRADHFKTKWGKGIAIETIISSKMVMRRAALEGAVIIAVVNPKSKFRSIRALNTSSADLSDAYKIVKKLEPKAEWYLHHSKKMLICGSDVAANVYLSKLPLVAMKKLIAV